MRVTGDELSRVNQQNAGALSAQQSRTQQPHPQNRATAQTRRQGAQGAELRNASEALTLMHKARAIIQNALNVSNRLQSMAASGYSSDGPDMNQIGMEIQRINQYLGEFGARVTSPAVEQIIQPESLRETGRSLAVLAQSEKPDGESLDSIQNSLDGRARAIEQEMVSVESRYNITREPDVEATAAVLRNNPGAAFMAQEAVSPETMARLNRA